MTYVANLPSLLPNGDVQKGVWIGEPVLANTYAELLDEPISSANDNNFVGGGSGNDDNLSSEYAEFNITDTPENFISMLTLNYNVRYRQVNRVDDTLNLNIRVETPAGTALTNTAAINGITSTIFINSGVTAFTLTTAGQNATKSDWDSAILLLIQRYTASMANDSAYIDVSAVELTGTYTAYRPELNYYNGSTWIWKPLFVYTGGQWVYKTLKRWNGTQWVREPD